MQDTRCKKQLLLRKLRLREFAAHDTNCKNNEKDISEKPSTNPSEKNYILVPSG